MMKLPTPRARNTKMATFGGHFYWGRAGGMVEANYHSATTEPVKTPMQTPAKTSMG